MGIGNFALKAVKCMFKNPSREGAKLYEQTPLAASLAFTGYSVYDTVKNIEAGNKKEKESMLNAYAGMGATFGSIFGVGGAILFGGGIKLLGEMSKPNFA